MQTNSNDWSIRNTTNLMKIIFILEVEIHEWNNSVCTR